jgi:hypothetical protein
LVNPEEFMTGTGIRMSQLELASQKRILVKGVRGRINKNYVGWVKGLKSLANHKGEPT